MYFKHAFLFILASLFVLLGTIIANLFGYFPLWSLVLAVLFAMASVALAITSLVLD